MVTGNQLRKFFVTLLTTNTMSKPDLVWAKTWPILADGILYERRKKLHIPGYLELHKRILFELTFFIIIFFYLLCRSYYK